MLRGRVHHCDLRRCSSRNGSTSSSSHLRIDWAGGEAMKTTMPKENDVKNEVEKDLTRERLLRQVGSQDDAGAELVSTAEIYTLMKLLTTELHQRRKLNECL